jgi:hypothetical protein
MRHLLIVTLGLLAFSAVALAAGDRYTVRTTKADTAAARAAMLTKRDLGSPADWKGGFEKPTFSPSLHCKGYHPRLSDLVITGAAKARYRQPGLEVGSDAEVFRSAEMMRLDWLRSAGSPKFLGCFRETLRRTATSGKRLVSFEQIPFPRLGAYSAAYRMLIDVKTPNGTARVVVDIVGIAQGRTEVTLGTTMPLTSVTAIFPNELVWAKQLLARAHA